MTIAPPPLTHISADTSLRITAIVTILALLLYSYMGLAVSDLRTKYHLVPPLVTGPPEFERAFRAHQNTLEASPTFLATLWIAASYFTPAQWLPAAVAIVWIVGRYLYMRGYVIAADKRRIGLVLQTLAMAVNLGLATAGALLKS